MGLNMLENMWLHQVKVNTKVVQEISIYMKENNIETLEEYHMMLNKKYKKHVSLPNSVGRKQI